MTLLFWIALGGACGAVGVVLLGVGYLQGRRSALREAAAELRSLSATLKQHRDGRPSITRQGEA